MTEFAVRAKKRGMTVREYGRYRADLRADYRDLLRSSRMPQTALCSVLRGLTPELSDVTEVLE